MIDALFKALAAGLSIWESKEKTKYVDEAIAIKTAWYEEYNKPVADRDHAVLDGLELRLRILVDGFASNVGSKNTLVL